MLLEIVNDFVRSCGERMYGSFVLIKKPKLYCAVELSTRRIDLRYSQFIFVHPDPSILAMKRKPTIATLPKKQRAAVAE